MANASKRTPIRLPGLKPLVSIPTKFLIGTGSTQGEVIGPRIDGEFTGQGKAEAGGGGHFEGLAIKGGQTREVGWQEVLDYQPDYVMVMPCVRVVGSTPTISSTSGSS